MSYVDFDSNCHSEEQEYCTRCKKICLHKVFRTRMANGAPWRKGRCRGCGLERSLPLTQSDREVAGLKKADFSKMRRWLELRYEVLREQRFKCQACGMPGDRTELHVDHIKPKSKYPHLALVKENLQVLCRDCNIGKSNKHEDDIGEIRMIDFLLDGDATQ